MVRSTPMVPNDLTAFMTALLNYIKFILIFVQKFGVLSIAFYEDYINIYYDTCARE
jgi:hypothetical protein